MRWSTICTKLPHELPHPTPSPAGAWDVTETESICFLRGSKFFLVLLIFIEWNEIAGIISATFSYFSDEGANSFPLEYHPKLRSKYKNWNTDYLHSTKHSSFPEIPYVSLYTAKEFAPFEGAHFLL